MLLVGLCMSSNALFKGPVLSLPVQIYHQLECIGNRGSGNDRSAHTSTYFTEPLLQTLVEHCIDGGDDQRKRQLINRPKDVFMANGVNRNVVPWVSSFYSGFQHSVLCLERKYKFVKGYPDEVQWQTSKAMLGATTGTYPVYDNEGQVSSRG